MILGSDTVTVLRGRFRNTSGDLAGTDTETDVPGGSFQPSSSSESTDRGELQVSSATWYAPAGTDVTATDRLRFGGQVYAVNGVPAVWRDENGTEDHVQVQALLKEGQG